MNTTLLQLFKNPGKATVLSILQVAYAVIGALKHIILLNNTIHNLYNTRSMDGNQLFKAY